MFHHDLTSVIDWALNVKTLTCSWRVQSWVTVCKKREKAKQNKIEGEKNEKEKHWQDLGQNSMVPIASVYSAVNEDLWRHYAAARATRNIALTAVKMVSYTSLSPWPTGWTYKFKPRNFSPPQKKKKKERKKEWVFWKYTVPPVTLQRPQILQRTWLLSHHVLF